MRNQLHIIIRTIEDLEHKAFNNLPEENKREIVTVTRAYLSDIVDLLMLCKCAKESAGSSADGTILENIFLIDAPSELEKSSEEIQAMMDRLGLKIKDLLNSLTHCIEISPVFQSHQAALKELTDKYLHVSESWVLKSGGRNITPSGLN